MSDHPTTNPTPRPQNGMSATILLIFLVAVLVSTVLQVRSCNKKAEAEKATAAANAAAQPPAPSRIPGPGPCEGPWSSRTLEIPAGGLGVHLCPGWEDHAHGGNITITTPRGQILHDQPGGNHDWGWQPEGMYIFLGDPAGSPRKVTIYNRW